jgi:hypothetical protein
MGGLPTHEAIYHAVNPGLPVGEYQLNDRDAYSVNNITATLSDDGTITVHFGDGGSQPNSLPIMDGWNYLIRLYRPRAEILNGTWTFPTISPVRLRTADPGSPVLTTKADQNGTRHRPGLHCRLA